MNSIIDSMLQFFGISAIPTDFPSFMFWLCSLLCGVWFLKSLVRICLDFPVKMAKVGDK